MFCTDCGTKITSGRFCSGCGKALSGSMEDLTSNTGKRSAPNASPSSSSSAVGIGARSNLSFDAFRERKEKERSSQFTKKPKCLSSKKEQNLEVTIQIGLMKFRDGELKSVRGSNLPLKVSSAIGKDELLQKGAEKMIKFNKDLCSNPEAFTLLYPDRSSVDCLPGSEEIFSLQKYKEELGKPYQRITLYLCLTTEYHELMFQELFSGGESDIELIDDEVN